jgi:DNA-binding SARP family transcriptional activator
VRVHDLGRTTLEVDGRLVALGESRRKAAALFLYLVTRQHQSATREQVMEQLWPDQNPRSASNSLHQTLFFLRRDIEAAKEQGPTADYVRMESDLIYLNPELVQIDSVAFHRQGAAVLAARQSETSGREILRLYTGRFAPEFEYEDWAEDWRGQVHAVFLRLAHDTGRALIDAARWHDASDALSHAVTVDPSALDLRSMLVHSLVHAGAADAAQAQYRVLAAAYERETGEPPPAFERLTRSIGDAVNDP